MSQKPEKPLIIVTGPTASGKSGVGVELARMMNGAVVSADSVQIYKGMDVGSAKITSGEMKGVEHFLISELDPDEDFNVSVFVKMAEAAMERIYASGRVPVITGGTAFYIQALLKGVMFEDTTGADEGFRRDCEEVYDDPDPLRLEAFFEKHFQPDHKAYACAHFPDDQQSGTGTYFPEYPLYGYLQITDPEYAETLHPNNRKRVIRALEYYRASGERYSEYNKREEARGSRFDHKYFVLEDDRGALYDRINKRVDKMMADGLEAEVRGLLEKGFDRNLKSMQSIGYKEMAAYIYGECSLEAAVEAIKQNTRHFAKRQMTWFRREKDVIPVDIREYGYDASKIAEEMLSLINGSTVD